MLRNFIFALLGSSALIASAPASAQTASAPDPNGGATMHRPESAAETAVLFGFEEPGIPTKPGPIGQYLLDHGVTVTTSYTAEPAGNPAGGIKQGVTYAGQVYFGLDLDLGKMINANGAYVHFAMVDRQGLRDSDEFIGNSVGPQEIFGLQAAHLAIFTIEQKFLDGRIDATLGRYPANITFLDSPLYCNFMSNSVCGNPALIYFASNFSGFPSSSYGADIRGWLTDKVYLHVGAFEINPTDHKGAYPFGNWSTAQATGAIIPMELGYATNFSNDELPRHYQIGGWWDGSLYTSPLYSANGGFAALNGQPYATEFGRSGLWLRFDQMLTRPDPNSKRGLSIFGVFMTALSGQPEMKQYYELGLLQQGTFPGRDYDTIGYVIGMQDWSSYTLQNIRLARLAVGSTAPMPHQTFMMELNYGWQVSSAIRVVPNLQYIIGPDTIREPSRPNIPNAFIIGCKLTVDLSNLLGFPVPPGT